jgi:hypothetical protein
LSTRKHLWGHGFGHDALPHEQIFYQGKNDETQGFYLVRKSKVEVMQFGRLPYVPGKRRTAQNYHKK